MGAMKRLTIQPLPDTPIVYQNVRSKLKESFRTYWLRENASRFGMQYFRYANGRVYWENSRYERKDLFVIQHEGACNTFIEPDGSCKIQPFDGVELEPEEREQIKAFCKNLIAPGSAYYDYFQRECRWLKWLQDHGPAMDGLLVEEAILALEAFE